MYKPYKLRRKRVLEENLKYYTHSAEKAEREGITEIAEMAKKMVNKYAALLQSFEKSHSTNYEDDSNSLAPKWSGYLGTAGLVRAEGTGAIGEANSTRKVQSMRRTCEEHGFVLDGAWVQEPFDANVWPFAKLQCFLQDSFEILVVQSLGDIATHDDAELKLPELLRVHQKLLYSLDDARTFEPEDIDLPVLLKLARS